jgi:LemA protein
MADGLRAGGVAIFAAAPPPMLRRASKRRSAPRPCRRVAPMTTSQIVTWTLAAVLIFWAVGAYNRLVGLRNALVRSFAQVEAQFRHRHALLLQLADALAAPGTPAPQQPVEALRAACLQADAACQRARSRPGVPGVTTSLRLAEEILVAARQRLPAEALDAALLPLHAELTAADNTLAFARRQFNEQVAAYNHAVRQFPTWLIAGMFRFHRAGTL